MLSDAWKVTEAQDVRHICQQRTFVSRDASVKAQGVSTLRDRQAHRAERAIGSVLAENPIWSKRTAILSLLGTLPAFLKPPHLKAGVLKSLKSRQPSTLTFSNQSKRAVKIYWNNYDADKEFFAKIPPSGQYTIDTWVSHPWSVVDAETGALVKEVIAEEGSKTVPINELEERELRDLTGEAQLQPDSSTAVAFDGLGGRDESYAPAQIAEVRFDSNGAVVILKADGFEELLAIAIGPAEAFNLYRTFGPETRRPSTLSTWEHSLEAVGAKLERVVLTRLVGSTYYSRLVLRQDGQLRSIDSRPSDSLALALQSKTPIFASKELMRVNEEESALAKKLSESQGAEVFIPEERGGRGLPGPDLPSIPMDPEYSGAFSA